MIVDCYTHTWPDASKARLSGEGNGRTQGVYQLPEGVSAGPERHLLASSPVARTLVVGFKSHHLEVELSNDELAAYVRRHRERMIGFAGVDPAEPREATEEVKRAHKELGLRGVSVAPAAQDFHPSNSQAMLVYAEASGLQMPVLFHTGLELTQGVKLEYARPLLLDEIARELPALKMVVAHLGFPWVSETILLLAKHPNVFAEISWILQQPWQAYQALLAAYQGGVMDKLLFGSGFPYMTASDSIEALYSINHLVQGTNLPSIPREALRGIVERDTLKLLQIVDPGPRVEPSPPPDEEAEEFADPII